MSRLLGQLILVGGVFAIVLGGGYPVMLEAQREEQLNHYPDKMQFEESLARRRYDAASAHPEKADEYLSAGDELASVCIRLQRYDEAVDIYQKQLAAAWKLGSDKYNPRYIDANIKLAGIFRDRSDWSTAQVCYKSALDLDKKYLPANDLKIARDLNNIGLTHYLQGLCQEKEADRQGQFQLAIDNLKAALDIINQHPEAKGQKASALWNLSLAERDHGDKAAAKAIGKTAQEIDNSMHRICRAP
jgi:hypothetical protein